MKKTICLLALAVSAACGHLEKPLPVYPRRVSSAEDTLETIQGTNQEGAIPPPDTVVWACGIQVPEGYDWVRDTAAGGAEATLLLFRDAEQVLSLPIRKESCLNSYPDTHHLAGGHVYSEFCSGTETFLSKDGVVIQRHPGNEFLKGILLRPEGLYTLSCNLTQGNLVFRRDGTELLRLASAIAFGGLGENSPALYEYDGKVCFGFTDGEACYLVKDGALAPVPLPEGCEAVLDCRMAGESVAMVWKGEGRIYAGKGGSPMLFCTESRLNGAVGIIVREDEPIVFGSLNKSYLCTMTRSLRDRSFRYYRKEGNFLFPCRDRLVGVSSSDGVRLAEPAETITLYSPFYSDPDGVVLSRECGAVAGEDLYLGVSSREGRPYLLKNEKPMKEYSFNGYLTGISVELIPPSL